MRYFASIRALRSESCFVDGDGRGDTARHFGDQPLRVVVRERRYNLYTGNEQVKDREGQGGLA